jgi:AcrR family transcriptional regulator
VTTIPTTTASLEEPSTGLRDRKKQKTRLAIQDAALELFVEQGFDATTVEQIAALAEVSTATFFRYFKTKGEVIFGDNGFRTKDLERSIVNRPASDDDLQAIRDAMRLEWIPSLDPIRVWRQTRAARTSALLRGLSADLGQSWQDVISRALAARHGLRTPDRQCDLTAAVALAVVSDAVNRWAQSDPPGDLAKAIDSGFALLSELHAGWRSPASKT